MTNCTLLVKLIFYFPGTVLHETIRLFALPNEGRWAEK